MNRTVQIQIRLRIYRVKSIDMWAWLHWTCIEMSSRSVSLSICVTMDPCAPFKKLWWCSWFWYWQFSSGLNIDTATACGLVSVYICNGSMNDVIFDAGVMAVCETFPVSSCGLCMSLQVNGSSSSSEHKSITSTINDRSTRCGGLNIFSILIIFFCWFSEWNAWMSPGVSLFSLTVTGLHTFRWLTLRFRNACRYQDLKVCRRGNLYHRYVCSCGRR